MVSLSQSLLLSHFADNPTRVSALGTALDPLVAAELGLFQHSNPHGPLLAARCDHSVTKASGSSAPACPGQSCRDVLMLWTPSQEETACLGACPLMDSAVLAHGWETPNLSSWSTGTGISVSHGDMGPLSLSQPQDPSSALLTPQLLTLSLGLKGTSSLPSSPEKSRDMAQQGQPGLWSPAPLWLPAPQGRRPCATVTYKGLFSELITGGTQTLIFLKRKWSDNCI